MWIKRQHLQEFEKVSWYLWNNEREVPWKTQKEMKSQCKAWRVAMKGAQSKSAVKELLSSPLPPPEIEHLVAQEGPLHPVQGIRKREPGPGSVELDNSANKGFIRTHRHKFELSLWRHPSFSHYTISELIKFAMVLYPSFRSFQDVFVSTSFLTPTLMSLGGEEGCNCCGHRILRFPAAV